VVAGVAVLYKTQRRPVPVLAKESWAQPAATDSNGAVASAGFTGDEASGLGPFLYRSHAPPAAATGFEQLAHTRADESSAGTGSFNLGVMLHQQGDVVGAIAAYKRAERRGNPDAAFNLGVILYESGDLDGAEASWRRSAQRGHKLAAANLEFLLRRRHELDVAGLAGDAGDQR
jgi:Flp pilus assembly protein TadD